MIELVSINQEILIDDMSNDSSDTYPVYSVWFSGPNIALNSLLDCLNAADHIAAYLPESLSDSENSEKVTDV